MIRPEEIISIRDNLFSNIVWVSALAAGGGLFHCGRRAWPHIKELAEDYKIRIVTLAVSFNILLMLVMFWITLNGAAGPSKVAGFNLAGGIGVTVYGAWCTFDIIREGVLWWKWRTKPSPPFDI